MTADVIYQAAGYLSDTLDDTDAILLLLPVLADPKSRRQLYAAPRPDWTSDELVPIPVTALREIGTRLRKPMPIKQGECLTFIGSGYWKAIERCQIEATHDAEWQWLPGPRGSRLRPSRLGQHELLLSGIAAEVMDRADAWIRSPTTRGKYRTEAVRLLLEATPGIPADRRYARLLGIAYLEDDVDHYADLLDFGASELATDPSRLAYRMHLWLDGLLRPRPAALIRPTPEPIPTETAMMEWLILTSTPVAPLSPDTADAWLRRAAHGIVSTYQRRIEGRYHPRFRRALAAAIDDQGTRWPESADAILALAEAARELGATEVLRSYEGLLYRAMESSVPRLGDLTGLLAASIVPISSHRRVFGLAQQILSMRKDALTPETILLAGEAGIRSRPSEAGITVAATVRALAQASAVGAGAAALTQGPPHAARLRKRWEALLTSTPDEGLLDYVSQAVSDSQQFWVLAHLAQDRNLVVEVSADSAEATVRYGTRDRTVPVNAGNVVVLSLLDEAGRRRILDPGMSLALGGPTDNGFRGLASAHDEAMSQGAALAPGWLALGME